MRKFLEERDKVFEKNQELNQTDLSIGSGLYSSDEMMSDEFVEVEQPNKHKVILAKRTSSQA